jgi:hypothetical protein
MIISCQLLTCALLLAQAVSQCLMTNLHSKSIKDIHKVLWTEGSDFIFGQKRGWNTRCTSNMQQNKIIEDQSLRITKSSGPWNLILYPMHSCFSDMMIACVKKSLILVYGESFHEDFLCVHLKIKILVLFIVHYTKLWKSTYIQVTTTGNWFNKQYSLHELVVAKPAACGVELAYNNLLVHLFLEAFGNCTNLHALFLENNPFSGPLSSSFWGLWHDLTSHPP